MKNKTVFFVKLTVKWNKESKKWEIEHGFTMDQLPKKIPTYPWKNIQPTIAIIQALTFNKSITLLFWLLTYQIVARYGLHLQNSAKQNETEYKTGESAENMNS